MKKIFEEYGSTIVVVVVVAALIFLVALLMQPGGVLDTAFGNLVQGFVDKSEKPGHGVSAPSVGELESKHQFKYYSSLVSAVNDVNAGTIGENADVDKADAVAGIYTDEGKVYVVLLKDSTEATRVTPSVDMTINLGGNVLSADNDTCIYVNGGNLTIDGRLSGSKVEMNRETTTTCVKVPSFSTSEIVTVLGGAYTATVTGTGSNSAFGFAVNNSVTKLAISNCTISVASDKALATAIALLGPATISDSSIVATAALGSTCIDGYPSTVTTVSNCNLMAGPVSVNGETQSAASWSGVYNEGTMTFNDCSIAAYSHHSSDGNSGYTQSVYGVLNNGTMTFNGCNVSGQSNYASNGNGDYTQVAYGIANNNAVTLNNCTVTGVHSSVSNWGKLNVNGGTYKGYGHGAFYFSGAGTTSYVQNASIRECAMPTGYTDFGPGCNGAGFYIGGTSSCNNISVYMNSCDISGSKQPFVLRGSSGEQNNTIYISNSKINLNSTTGIRIDNNTHKLFIGTGCNFTANDTTLPEAVTQTSEVYVQN